MPVAFHARTAVSKIHSLDNVPGARGHVPKIDSFAQAGSLDDFVRQILLDALKYSVSDVTCSVVLITY